MMSIFTIITRDFTSRNNQIVNIRAGSVALATNVALNLWMIPAFGIVGAALATSISYSLAAILVLAPYRRESGLTLSQMVIPTSEDARFLYELGRDAAARGVERVALVLVRVRGGGSRIAPGQ